MLHPVPLPVGLPAFGNPGSVYGKDMALLPAIIEL